MTGKVVDIPVSPRSSSYMWKIVRYAVDGGNVVGIGTFSTHAALFFYRGRELEDRTGLLEGGGKEMRFIRLNTPADAGRPAVKRMVQKAVKHAREVAVRVGRQSE